MTDRYVPALDDFELTADEQAAVTEALATAKPWDWEPTGVSSLAIKSAKARIRDYHLARHNHRCCYCRMNLHGAGPFMTDREHVLPKSVPAYVALAYEMWNLGIACKRCNMEYKKDKTDFVVDPGDAAALTGDGNYRIIHPNFDLYSEHIARSAAEVDDSVIVKYKVAPDSSKGAYTYDYFNLKGLEIGSFDEGQGLTIARTSGPLSAEVKALAEAFGQ